MSDFNFIFKVIQILLIFKPISLLESSGFRTDNILRDELQSIIVCVQVNTVIVKEY